jgi:hypothetical protein
MDALDLSYTDVLDVLIPDALAVCLLGFMLGWLFLRRFKKWPHNPRDQELN